MDMVHQKETSVIDLKIDPEFRSLIPPLTTEEIDGLESNIEANGCTDPLIFWGKERVLLDGHNRYDICTRRGWSYQTLGIELSDRDEAMMWIIRRQFDRRNLAPFARAELAMKLGPLIRLKAKQNLATSTGGTDPRPLPKSAKAVDTREEISKLAGFGHDTLDKAKYIAMNADEETKDRLRRGETKINTEYNRLRGSDDEAREGERVKTAREWKQTERKARRSKIEQEICDLVDEVYAMTRESISRISIIELRKAVEQLRDKVACRFPL